MQSAESSLRSLLYLAAVMLLIKYTPQSEQVPLPTFIRVCPTCLIFQTGLLAEKSLKLETLFPPVAIGQSSKLLIYF